MGDARDINWIMSVLPHRYPFLLIDRVLELEPGRRVVASKNVSVNEPFFNGHFPGHPIMPGVLLVEGMAQAAGVLLMHELEDRSSKLIYFAGIDRARFRRPVVPGDQVIFEVSVLRARPAFAKLEGRALVDGQLCAEAVCSSSMVDR